MGVCVCVCVEDTDLFATQKVETTIISNVR